MKKALRILCAVLSAVLLASSASAAAPGIDAKPLSVVPNFMKVLNVTSSITDDNRDTSVLFDGDTSTGFTVTFPADTETATFTLRTSTGLPAVLSALAVTGSAPEGTVMNIRILATNDNTEQEWTALTLRYPVTAADEWRVVKIAMPEGGWQNAEAYTFYRIEIQSVYKVPFALNEVLLITPDLGAPEMTYASVEVVEEGETPPIIQAFDLANKLPRKLRWGLAFPGFMK